MKLYRVSDGTMISEWHCPQCRAKCVNATVNIGTDPSDADLLCDRCARALHLRVHPDKDPPVIPMA